MEAKNNNLNKIFATGIIGILGLRLILNYIIPLYDQTEARYAEVARIMAETNNWISPQIDYNVPFWAKPPLSTWFSALSIQILGENEFAVRFPYFLMTVFLLYFVYQFVKKQQEGNPLLAVFVLLCLPEFLLHIGVVSTDMALSVCIAVVMLSFWNVMMREEKRKIWENIFFIALGLGLLAKGPIVFILTIPPLFLWALWYRKLGEVFQRFSIVKGIALSLLVALPWYYLAEQQTEGFIDYFIVGEHFRRYFDSTWSGDKYGFPKQQPLGIVWVFLLGLTIPWIPVIFYRLWKKKQEILQNEWLVFLLLWLLWTPLFFTVSRSLIHTYILPVMVPIALLTTLVWDEVSRKKLNLGISLIPMSLVVVVSVLLLFNGSAIQRVENTDKFLLAENTDTEKLYYLGNKSFSSQFYSGGKIENIDAQELVNMINQNDEFYVIIPVKELKKIPKEILEKLVKVKHNSKKILFGCNVKYSTQLFLDSYLNK